MEKEEERESRKEAMLCAGVLYECLAREKPDLLPLHVYVLHVVKALKRGMSPVAAACTVRTLRLILTYYAPNALLRRRLSSGTGPRQTHAQADSQTQEGEEGLEGRILFTVAGGTAGAGETEEEEEAWLLQEDLVHSLRVRMDELFAPFDADKTDSETKDTTQKSHTHRHLRGAYRLYYDLPAVAGKGEKSSMEELPLLRKESSHVALASLLRQISSKKAQ